MWGVRYGSSIQIMEARKRRLRLNRLVITSGKTVIRLSPSGDVLWKIQFLREKGFKQTIPQVKIADGEEISYEKTTATVKRAAHYFAALQASDGHWPVENAGPLFFLPPL